MTVYWNRPSNNKYNFDYFQPILQYFYHQIYHLNSNSNDCVGEKSVSRYVFFSSIPFMTSSIVHYSKYFRWIFNIVLCRCILIKETREIRHLKNIRNALIEIQLNDLEQKKDASHSLKAYQTIKCEFILLFEC